METDVHSTHLIYIMVNTCMLFMVPDHLYVTPGRPRLIMSGACGGDLPDLT